MNADLKITTEQIQAKVPVTVFHMRGWLDAQSEALFVKAAQDAHTGGARYLLLDLQEVDTLTSAGMRAIQKAYKLFTPEGEHFVVPHILMCNAPPQIYHILGITGFLQNIPNYENMQAALDSFRE